MKKIFSKNCVKWPLSKRLKTGFQDQLSLNAGQKYCRMLQGEHSAILLTCIKLPFAIKIFIYFEWPFYTGFTVHALMHVFCWVWQHRPNCFLQDFSEEYLIENLIFLFLNQNICSGYSNEPSQ